MKVLSRGVLLAMIVFLSFQTFAQETCKVLMPSIAGKYQGDCKKGNANGIGKAEGVDLYEGQFKDGLPSGTGTYLWKNGDSYEGSWSNGKRDGEGKMTYKKKGNADSVVAGIWKKDSYIGKNLKPYKVYSRTLQVSRSEVEYKPSKEGEIIVSLSNTTGNMPLINGQITPKVTLGQVVISQGSYTRILTVSDTARQISYKLENVLFPFRAKFRFGNQEVDVLFSEYGSYTMDVVLNN